MSEEAVEVSQSTPQPYITENGIPVGPIADVEYPITVVYCGNCGLPTEVLDPTILIIPFLYPRFF